MYHRDLKVTYYITWISVHLNSQIPKGMSHWLCVSPMDYKSIRCISLTIYISFLIHNIGNFSSSMFLPEASFGLQVLSLPLSVCMCVRLCMHQSCACPRDNSSPIQARITKGKRPWSRSLLFCGAIDLDFQGQIELQSQNLPHFEHKCILALFRSLPILGLIEIDLQFNFQFKTQTKLSFLCTSLAFFSETS